MSATSKAVSSILAEVEDSVEHLDHDEYIEVLAEVIDDLRQRLYLAEKEKEEE